MPFAKRLKLLKIVREADDPITAVRASIGGGGGIVGPDEAYLSFRGDPEAVCTMLERVTATFREQLNKGEKFEVKP